MRIRQLHVFLATIAFVIGMMIVGTLFVSDGEDLITIGPSASEPAWGLPSTPLSPCIGNPFAPSIEIDMSLVARNAEKWLANKGLRSAEVLNMSRGVHNSERFKIFDELAPCRFDCIGGNCEADSAKRVCGMENLVDPCVVYAVGSNNDWAFENAMVARTKCEVHSFDCTGPKSRFNPPDHPRLHFHYWCAGEAEEPETSTKGPVYTMGQMMQKLGHPVVHFLKMDIEGFEWPVFAGFTHGGRLPMQIAVEVHYRTAFRELEPRSDVVDWKSEADIADLYENLIRLGYVVAVNDINTICPHCTELTLIRYLC